VATTTHAMTGADRANEGSALIYMGAMTTADDAGSADRVRRQKNVREKSCQ
jgi:hypothetical protein